MMKNSQFSKMEFVHDGEVLTDVQHGSIPNAGESVRVETNGGVVLRGVVDGVRREYTKSFRNEITHDVDMVAVVFLQKVLEFNIENDGV